MNEEKIAVNAMYPTFQGEVNNHGIGSPVIFLRLQGCHIRCYEKTLGNLCDTPEALERNDKMGITIPEIMQRLNEITDATGIRYICLSGGDPLWRNPKLLRKLLWTLIDDEYEVSVETSGTLSMREYSDIPNVSWVLDYKLESAGIKLPFVYSDLPLLSEKDFIKFVVYDENDYQQVKVIVPELRRSHLKVKIAIGPYWGGKILATELFNKMLADKLTEHAVFNVQLHKMATFCDFNSEQLSKINIPTLI